ncbi:ABC transporter substrate-binding protein [Avibacterium gallinarum]|uniref:D-ribose-binding periplasmic protein RbsB-1 n=1 Tax=Avibacterium gallinarum TaxID=755 RepID=A0A379B0A0_AVIGA|nr:substrate-binding domain-containing protein [Avibacterium gallinarum]POY44179.1 ABC transporter substrate-binding protein [Avibacterium gallinarum]TDP29293.1 ribose transport system substrate-binding protein [Avibacterium gallinarum]SUB28151.1 D-ribose-binding periplasmic protein RbsB-1 [Avibacterium gallinarum]
MKKLITALALSLSVAATAVADDKIKVGFANRTLNGAFFNGLTEYMKIHAKDAGYELITTDARGDLNKQIADVEDMLSQGIDYLVLNPQDPVAGIKITEMAKRAKVPTIALDSDIALSAPVITRIQANNAANNKMIGEFAVSQFGKEPINLVLISGNQGNLVGEARRNNFLIGVMDAQIRQYNQSKVNVISQVWGNWDQQGGLKAMEDALVAHGDKINAVYAEMDDMALGGIRALKAAGKLKNVKVYAHDGYKFGLEAIKKGTLQATASNNPDALTKLTIDTIKAYQAGKRDFPDYLYIKPLLITKENVDEVYNPDSLY